MAKTSTKSAEPKEQEKDKTPSQAFVDEGTKRAAVDTILDNVRITDRKVETWFTYQQPSAEDVERITRMRKAFMACAQIIRNNTPANEDQTAALRHLRESMMTANAAIVCNKR